MGRRDRRARPCAHSRGGPRPALARSGGPRPFSRWRLPTVAPGDGAPGFGTAVLGADAPTFFVGYARRGLSALVMAVAMMLSAPTTRLTPACCARPITSVVVFLN